MQIQPNDTARSGLEWNKKNTQANKTIEKGGGEEKPPHQTMGRLVRGMTNVVGAVRISCILHFLLNENQPSFSEQKKVASRDESSPFRKIVTTVEPQNRRALWLIWEGDRGIRQTDADGIVSGGGWNTCWCEMFLLGGWRSFQDAHKWEEKALQTHEYKWKAAAGKPKRCVRTNSWEKLWP